MRARIRCDRHVRPCRRYGEFLDALQVCGADLAAVLVQVNMSDVRFRANDGQGSALHTPQPGRLVETMRRPLGLLRLVMCLREHTATRPAYRLARLRGCWGRS